MSTSLPLNVVEILKLGLSGLVFLFAYLGYRLLSKEQSNERPRKEAFRNIVLFNVFTFLSALMVGIFSIVPMLSSHERDLATCRDSFSRLVTASKLQSVTTDDLRGAIQTHVERCRDLTEDGSK